MTVHQKIKQMNAKEMAHYLVNKNKICNICIYGGKCKGVNCTCEEGVEAFLKLDL